LGGVIGNPNKEVGKAMAIDEVTQKSLCIECKSIIPHGASLCSTCSSFQTRWKNQAKFAANTIGILSVAVALMSYIISALPSIRRTILWKDDATVLTFIDSRIIAVANTGDGEIFLSHVFIEYDPEQDGGPGRLTRLLDQSVDPGKTIVISSGYWEKYDYSTYQIVSSVSDDEWNELYQQSNPVSQGGCVVLDFSSENDPLLIMYRAHLGENLRGFSVNAQLYYYSSHSGKLLTKEFPAYGVLKKSTNTDCKSQ
jgi:hypothetical protein